MWLLRAKDVELRRFREKDDLGVTLLEPMTGAQARVCSEGR